MGKTIMQLKIERKRLLKLANKQFQQDRKIRAAQEEKRRLKKQVRTLKRRTSKSIIARTRRLTRRIQSTATSPQAKRRLIGLKGEIKRKFSKFQDFADRFS
ncbi:hypothetical protein LCGC14_0548090 [marine sediment metagenome]|uniref:Uncharacterized protein n=1 Tax=marine sediment metagenome TaxID=412755 RepID=A0A0F9UYY9_9ZZZZ